MAIVDDQLNTIAIVADVVILQLVGRRRCARANLVKETGGVDRLELSVGVVVGKIEEVSDGFRDADLPVPRDLVECLDEHPFAIDRVVRGL